MNKYSHLHQPEATLDFHEHGMLDGSAVKRMTEAFVRDSAKRGLHRIRIVTGRGVHSQGSPLVGPQVRRTLDQLRRAGIVERFGEAKIGEGGEGAVDVVLTPPE